MENFLKPKQHDFKNRKGLAPLAVQALLVYIYVLLI
jgi:hypothetical protein